MQAPKSEIEPDDRTIMMSGTGIDHSVAAMMAVTFVASMLGKKRRPTPPKPAQIAARTARDERDAWNAAVDERRRVKQTAKKGYAK
jgi:hypothetical protein